MNGTVPRLRMFAGPNGSGKSTIKSCINSKLLGFYINPDEIEQKLLTCGAIDLSHFEIETEETDILSYFQQSDLLKNVGFTDQLKFISFTKNCFSIPAPIVNSYYASVLSDFIRHKLLDARKSFTFETVMSSHDKVVFLRRAQSKGFRTYLYYVATEDPNINIYRIRHRVKTGGHNVPEDKVISRYERSLNLLLEAIRSTNRAYIFDNSGHQQILIAEISEGTDLALCSERMPMWFKHAVIDKINQ